MIIDITNELITDIIKGIPDITILAPHQFTTKQFPCVVVEEVENVDDKATKDSSGFTHANVSYSVEIYTTGPTRISEAKNIRNQVNKIVSEKYGLERGLSRPIPNYLDGEIYRYQITYSGKIDKKKIIYRG